MIIEKILENYGNTEGFETYVFKIEDCGIYKTKAENESEARMNASDHRELYCNDETLKIEFLGLESEIE
jgi:hypothetical protein